MRLALILLLALTLRLLFTFVWAPDGALRLDGDAAAYHQIAQHFMHGEGFSLQRGDQIRPTAQVAGPLYPIFLSLMYQPTDPDGNPNAARFVQVLLGVSVCWSVFLIGRALFSENAGLLAAFIVAIYPPFLSWSYYGGPAFLLTENLSVPLFTASIASVLTGWPLLAGLTMGGAILSRSTLLLFPLLVIAWLMTMQLEWPYWGKHLIARFVVGLTIAVTPWIARNMLTLHTAQLSTQGGVVFWYGNNPQANGGYVKVPIPHTESLTDERAISQAGYLAGLHALADHLSRVPTLLVKKALVFWSPIADTNEQPWRMNWAFILVSLSAIVGWWKARHEPHQWLPLVMPMAYLTMVALIFFGDPRFRLPIEPLLIVLSAQRA